MHTRVLLDELHAARDRAAPGSGRQAVLDRLSHLATTLIDQASAVGTPAGTRTKIDRLLRHIEEAYETLGARLFHTGFALNVVGEGMARTQLVHREVVEFLQVGLYFFGLDHIERRWSSQATVYSGIHADHLEEFLARPNLKSLVAGARERLASDRVFCLTYAYLNSLRKAYWKYCRASEDALDVAVTGEPSGVEQPAFVAASEEPEVDPSDRVGLMLDIFGRSLSDQQRWIYLAKNRSSFHETDMRAVGDHLVALLSGEGAPPGFDLGWGEISRRLGINEKTAKREYLRTLHTLLQESSERVFGNRRIPSHYVRHILKQIRAVVYEKDLRVRSSTGRGINTLVEKWEVALRFVLNHDRVVA